MGAIEKLPSDYREIYSVNLQKDKKTAIIINGLALIIGATMIILMNFFIPVSYLFNMEKGLVNYLLKFLVLMVSIVAYMCLHELVHGITMKLLGTKKSNMVLPDYMLLQAATIIMPRKVI